MRAQGPSPPNSGVVPTGLCIKKLGGDVMGLTLFVGCGSATTEIHPSFFQFFDAVSLAVKRIEEIPCARLPWVMGYTGCMMSLTSVPAEPLGSSTYEQAKTYHHHGIGLLLAYRRG